MSVRGYGLPWAGLVEIQPSSLYLHALITPPGLLNLPPCGHDSHGTPGGGLNERKSEMTERDVCPDAAESAQIGPQRTAWRPKARSTGRECRSWFPDGAYSATIGPEFGIYPGNVDQSEGTTELRR